jgi:hypothetical protein
LPQLREGLTDCIMAMIVFPMNSYPLLQRKIILKIYAIDFIVLMVKLSSNLTLYNLEYLRKVTRIKI